MSRDDHRLDPMPLSPPAVLERELAIDRRARRPLTDFNATQPGVVNPLTGAPPASAAAPRSSRLAIEPNEPVRMEPRASMSPHAATQLHAPARQATTDRVQAVPRPQVTAPPPAPAPSWATESTAVVKGPPAAPAPSWASESTAVVKGPPAVPAPGAVPPWAASTAVVNRPPPAAPPAWAASTAVVKGPPAAPEPDASRAPTMLAMPVLKDVPLAAANPGPAMPTIRPQTLGPAVLPGHQQRPLTPSAASAPLGDSPIPPTAAASPRAMPSAQLKRPTTPAPVAAPPAAARAPLPAAPAADVREGATVTQEVQLPPSTRPPLGSGFAVTQPGVAGPFAKKAAEQPRDEREEEQPPPPRPHFEASPADFLSDAIDSEVRKLPTEVRQTLAAEADAAARAGEVESLEVIARPASLWRRLGATVLDLGLFAGLLGGATLAVLTVKGPKLPWAAGLSGLLPVALEGLKHLALPLAATAGALLFTWLLAFSWLFNGRSPGRKLFGLHLVDGRGHCPSLPRALARTLFTVPSLALALGGFWLSLFDRRGQSLHDKLSATFVVRLTTED